MSYKVIAKNNIKNSFGLYRNYFGSLALVLTLFNTLQIFANDKVIGNALSGSSKLIFMSYVTSCLFTLFTIFYIIYFNRFFLKQRLEELGIYSMLGMSKKQITLILMVENIIILGFAFLFGTISSVFFYSLIKVVLILVLKLNISFLTPFKFSPFVVTLELTVVMLLVVFLDDHYAIKHLSILNISNLTQTNEKAIKVKPWMAYLGILSLIIGYMLILNLAKRQQSLWNKFGFAAMAILTLVLVILGTFLIIKSTLAYFINQKITNHHQLYKPVNNIFLPESLFKLKTKSNLLIVLSLIISAVIALTATSFMTINYQNASLMKTIPSAIEIDQKLSPRQINKMKKITQKYGGQFKAVRIVSVPFNKPIAITNKVFTNNAKIISERDYQKLFKQQNNNQLLKIHLSKNTAYLFTLYPIKNSTSKIQIGHNKVKLKQTHFWPTYAKGNYAYVVVNDQSFKKISFHNPSQMIYAINGPKLRNNAQLYHEIKRLNVKNLSAYQKNNYVVKYNSPMILMTTFISALLFIFIGCILYFTTFIENIDIIEEFRFLDNIGYNKKQLRKIATADNLLLFLPPVIMGLLNGLIAFIGFGFEFLTDIILAFLGTFTLIGIPIIGTCLIFLSVYGIIYAFSYKKTKTLLKI